MLGRKTLSLFFFFFKRMPETTLGRSQDMSVFKVVDHLLLPLPRFYLAKEL